MAQQHSDPSKSASYQQINAARTTSEAFSRTLRDTKPIQVLSNLSFVSNNIFSTGLSRVEGIIKGLPIQLPDTCRYFLEATGNELHLYASGRGIEQFALTDQDSSIRQIGQNDEGTVIEVASGSGIISVILHRQSYELCKGISSSSYDGTSSQTYETSRRTSPWRSSQVSSYEERGCSESHGGFSGER